MWILLENLAKYHDCIANQGYVSIIDVRIYDFKFSIYDF